MQFKKTLLSFSIFLSPFLLYAQTTYIPRSDKSNIAIERLEILSQKNKELNFSSIQPFSRETTMGAMQDIVNNKKYDLQLSKVDSANLESLYLNNQEWIEGATDEAAYDRKNKIHIFKNFYKQPANLYEVHIKDFDLVINPVLQFTYSKEFGNDNKLFLNTRGLDIRGRIGKKIGFYTYVADNQERTPIYVQNWTTERGAVPGVGWYSNFKDDGGVNYWGAKGYITFGITKYIDVQFGYDKNFIGNGYRSLLLSDFGADNLFLKLNTKIWKFNYQNLFMELVPSHSTNLDHSTYYSKSYAAMHYLDFQLSPSVNLGVFEGLVYHRSSLELSYLNPIIFYRSAEVQAGGIDNAIQGLNVKANIKRTLQVYGQFLLDDLNISKLKTDNGGKWWGEKWGFQLGAKYINAFGVKNLDIQLETNRVRPYVYSHYDSTNNYSHYNQPLAHPLGANFQEYIGIIRYQPVKRLLLQTKLITYKKGLDYVTTKGYGGNIFLPNFTENRVSNYIAIGDGHKQRVLFGEFLASYELRENIFVDFSAVHRSYKFLNDPISSDHTTILSVGFRWNMGRRDFSF